MSNPEVFVESWLHAQYHVGPAGGGGGGGGRQSSIVVGPFA